MDAVPVLQPGEPTDVPSARDLPHGALPPPGDGRPRGRFSLSPLNRRRLANFKRNRRGYWSFLVFSVLFVLSLFAEVIANDKPILLEYDGAYYFPVLKAYPETTFGGDFETQADYRDPYLQKLIAGKGGWMIWPPVRYSFDTPNTEAPTPAPSPPAFLLTPEQRCSAYPQGLGDRDCVFGNMNWLGTDDQGRDVIARALYGFRISVLFGLALTIVSSAIGVTAGAVQGYFGGWVDLLFQRFIEIWSAIPVLYLLLIVAAVLPPGFFILLGLMLLFSWVAFVGVVRAEFLRARNFEYVNAARALGVPNRTIIFRHLLPNAMVATLTFMPFILNGSISTLTSLDFLGFGLPPGSASLGELLKQGQRNLNAPWLGIAGFVTLSIMLSLLIFIGEATRDAFDPRKTFK